MSIELLIESLKNDWNTPKHSIVNGQSSPFQYVCRFSEVRENAPEKILNEIEIPIELSNFWGITKSATLFEDVDYGQWGMKILEPSLVMAQTQEYFEQRKQECRKGDLVVGEFLGDSELLVVRCDESTADYGSVLIAMPLDVRADWYILSLNFEEFLLRYVKSGGEKFWELV